MMSLWESGVRGSEWMLIYEMNKTAEIIVETPWEKLSHSR